MATCTCCYGLYGWCLFFLLLICCLAVPESDLGLEGELNKMSTETKGIGNSCTTEMATPEATPLINMFSRQQTSPNSDLNQNSINIEDPTATAFTDDATCTDSEGGGCYQLVPYKPSPILPVFQEEKRSFEFAGKEWSVHQQWNDVGLASVVWEAALLLSQYLEVLGEAALKGKRVIELGAGTGLVGFIASALGAESVIITDKTITPAEINLKANQHNLLDKNVTVAQYEWGKDPSHLRPPFDVVLAADVIYIEETFPLLLQSLVDLSNRETVILLSCKRRYERDDRFFDLLRESGRFSYSVVWQWPKEKEAAQELENDVKVYEIRLVS